MDMFKINALEKMLESVLTSREDRILKVLFNFQKDVIEELFLMKKLLLSLQLNNAFENKGKLDKFKTVSTRRPFDENQISTVEKQSSNSPNISNVKLEILEQADEKCYDENQSCSQVIIPIGVVPNAEIIPPINTKPNIKTSKQIDSLKICDQSTESRMLKNMDDGQVDDDSDFVYNFQKLNYDKLFKFIGSNHSLLSYRVPLKGDSAENEIRCSVCNRRFSRKLHLEEHLSVHTKEKRYKCLICGKLFCTKSGVYRHIKCHSGLKPYKCDTCGRAFAQKACLQRHYVTHTQQRLFQCHICDKKFSRKGNLNQHLKLHSNSYDVGEESHLAHVS